MRFRSLASVVVLGLVAAVTAAPVPAAAEDGFWYFDDLNVQSAHDAGWTGEGVTIAVMDGPVNMDIPTLVGANVEVREPSYCQEQGGSGFMPATSTALSGQGDALHGTDVLSLISGTGEGYPGQTGVKGVAPGASVLYYAIAGSKSGDNAFIECLDENGDEITDIALAEAMNDAMDAGARIISVSSLQTPGPELYAAQIRALREGVIVVGGLPNSRDVSFSGEWPGTANGAVGVQAADSSATIPATDGLPNTNESTTVIAPGVGLLAQGTAASWEEQRSESGTSLATPIVAGFLSLVAQKYPLATGNQLLHTLIQNTGVEDHPLDLDPTGAIGYGFVSASHMLRVDPTQYPDVNPLISDGPAAIPTIEEIAAGSEEGAEPSPSPTQIDEASPSSSLVWLLATVGIGALVLIGAIALVVVLIVRRSRRAGPSV